MTMEVNASLMLNLLYKKGQRKSKRNRHLMKVPNSNAKHMISSNSILLSREEISYTAITFQICFCYRCNGLQLFWKIISFSFTFINSLEAPMKCSGEIC